VIDDHAHPFTLEPGPLDVADLTLDFVDPADSDRRRRLRPTHLWYELLTVRLAGYLGCRPDEVVDARAERSADYRSYTTALFADAGITEIVMDPAWPMGRPGLAATYEELSGCRIHLLHRIDPLVDRHLEEGSSFAEIVGDFDAALDQARADGFVGFKTIVAYRTGLSVSATVSEAEARASVGRDADDVPIKRRAKPLRDLLVRRALSFSADTGLPLQIHTGFGDSDIRLSDANPLLLEEVLRTPEGTAAPIVLIHGAFPYHEEVGFLATARPNVHVDFSLFNLFAPARLTDRLLTLLELAPTGKVLAGTDGFSIPEAFWFAATITRDAWSGVARHLLDLGARSAWVQTATSDIFEDNARRLYSLAQ
jgi:predicted TIM-barrel fold metal-dependent hydrolase